MKLEGEREFCTKAEAKKLSESLTSYLRSRWFTQDEVIQFYAQRYSQKMSHKKVIMQAKVNAPPKKTRKNIFPLTRKMQSDMLLFCSLC